MQGVLRLIIPVECTVREGLPYTRLGDNLGEPCEMLRDIEESRGGSEEITVVVLTLAQCQPCVMEERVELVAGAESLLLCRPVLARRFLLDGVKLDGLLHLLDGAREIARGLRHLLIGTRLGGMGQEHPRVVVGVILLHVAQLLHEVLVTVVIDVIAGGERLPVARRGGILLGAAPGQEQRHHRHYCQQDNTDCRRNPAIPSVANPIFMPVISHILSIIF